MSHVLQRVKGRAAVLALVAGAIALAGCGGSGGDTGGSTGSGDGSEHLTLVVQGVLTQNFKPVVAAYEKANPEMEVTLTQGPQDESEYVTQLATQRLGGQSVDLFTTLGTLNDRFVDSGFAENLVNWFGKDGGLAREDFASQYLDAYAPLKEPDAIGGLPVSADATVVFYNKELFKKAGLAMPTDSWTYDEYLEDAQKISAVGDGQFWGLAPAPDGEVPATPWQAQWEPMITNMGGFVFDSKSNTVGVGEPKALEAWEVLLEPYQDGSIPEYSLVSGASPPTFAGGQYGMEVCVRALIPSLQEALGDNWDVVQMPTIDGQRPVGGGSYGLSMAASSKNKETAWEFLNWFYSNQGGMKVLQATYSVVPPTIEGINKGSWRELPPPPSNIEVFPAAIKDAVMSMNLPGKARGSLDEEVSEAVQKVLLNGTSVEQAFQEAQDNVNALLEAEGG